jgi:hypothetical protein
MDVYPRSRTWPYLIIVVLLFLLALAGPDRWGSWRDAGMGRLQRIAQALGGRTGPRGPARAVPQALVIEPAVAVLQPPVSQRVAVSPEPSFAASSDHATTAQFPPDAVEDAGRQQGATRGASGWPAEVIDPVGPIPPPTPPRPLDLTPADIEGLADSLPADVTEHRAMLQSAADATAPLPSAWPRPVSLWDATGRLGTESAQVAAWANQVQDTLNALQTVPTLVDPRAGELIERMRALAERAPQLEVYLTEANRCQLRRVRYGLERRGDVWGHVHELARQQQATPRVVNVAEVVPILKEIDRRMAEHPFGASWRRYLMLDKLTLVATETWVSDPTVRRDTARTVLQHSASDKLTPDQQHELNDPAIQHLRRQLEDWAEGPVDLPTLVAALEQFEQVRSITVAAAVVQQMRALKFCRDAGAAGLDRALDVHYRNANFRCSVSARLLNDMLPILEPMDQQIRDRILGAVVSGQNRTWTDLHVRLVEDAEQLRLQVEADGESRSRTVSIKGPVRLYSRDRSRFRAGKQLIVSPQGIFVSRAMATANGQSTLLDVQTDYDQIPLLGWIVRQIALDEHDEQRPRIRAEIQQRISGRARQQLDDSVHERLSNMEAKLDKAVIQPLRELQLDPKAMEMRTTPDRLVMRYRLAAGSQLAAYTPRPRGAPDNYLSLQLHESLANNLLAQLHLEDQRIELEELMRRLSERLSIQRQDIHEEIPPDVVLHLGSDRPIQVEFDEERVLVTFRIKELKAPRNTWRNFVVRGRYRADVAQTHVDLERDGGIELISEQLGFRDQVALRGIFTKVITHDHRLNILRGRFLSDPRLMQLGVTQFVARDGWIGISVGPLGEGEDRVARESTRP